MLRNAFITTAAVALLLSIRPAEALDVQTSSIANPRIEVTCASGAEAAPPIVFTLKQDDERPNYFHTGTGPDPSFAPVFETDLTRVEVYVVLERSGGKYFVEGSHARYFPGQNNAAFASGGVSFPRHTFELKRNSALLVLAEREGDLGGFISYAQCAIRLLPLLSSNSSVP